MLEAAIHEEEETQTHAAKKKVRKTGDIMRDRDRKEKSQEGGDNMVRVGPLWRRKKKTEHMVCTYTSCGVDEGLAKPRRRKRERKRTLPEGVRTDLDTRGRLVCVRAEGHQSSSVHCRGGGCSVRTPGGYGESKRKSLHVSHPQSRFETRADMHTQNLQEGANEQRIAKNGMTEERKASEKSSVSNKLKDDEKKERRLLCRVMHLRTYRYTRTRIGLLGVTSV